MLTILQVIISAQKSEFYLCLFNTHARISIFDQQVIISAQKVNFV